jgi:hypothetical protein
MIEEFLDLLGIHLEITLSSLLNVVLTQQCRYFNNEFLNRLSHRVNLLILQVLEARFEAVSVALKFQEFLFPSLKGLEVCS